MVITIFLGCQDIINFDLIWKLALPTILVIIGLSIIFKDKLGGKVNDEIKKLNEKEMEQIHNDTRAKNSRQRKITGEVYA